MKKIICFLLIFTMMLTACSKRNVEIVDPTKPIENDSELVVSEGEESMTSEEWEELPLVSLSENIEFWREYSEKYDVRIDGWASDNYYFIILKSKEDENFRYLFWDVKNEKIIDLGEHETELFLANHTFSRDGKFYMISSPDRIMEIELGSFEILYIDIKIPDGYIEKELQNTLSLSPLGIVAEFKDEFTLLIYDIFNPEQKKTVNLNEAAPLGAMLNQGINWSFDGKYFSVFVYEEDGEYHEDSTYAIFNFEGEYIRNVTGADREIWDKDQVWTWSYEDENEGKFLIYSLKESDSEPIKVSQYVSDLNQIRPRNGIYYYQQENDDKTECKIIMVDSLKGIYKPVARFDVGSFGWIPEISPNGKHIALKESDSEHFFFKFINLEKEVKK